MHLSVIIPAYNEEKVIANAIVEVEKYFFKQGYDFEVIVVDDGSCDRTNEIVRAKQSIYQNLKLLDNETNRGKGFAVRYGALESHGDWILFLDADLSTEPQEFEKFKSPMNIFDIIIGSRSAKGAKIIKHQPFLRELAGKLANKAIKFYLGLPHNDTQCGFKLFNRKTIQIFQDQKLHNWLFDAELLYLAQLYNFKVKEISIIWTNDPTTTLKGYGPIKLLKDLILIKKIHGSKIDNTEKHSVCSS